MEDDVISSAWAAFRHFPLPPPGRLLGTHVDAGEMPDLEAAFMSSPRKVVPFEAMRDAHIVMHYLTSEAFLHFLPRMIELSLDYGEEAGDIENGVELAFSTLEDGTADGMARRQRLEAAITPQGRAVLRSFFETWRSRHGGTRMETWV